MSIIVFPVLAQRRHDVTISADDVPRVRCGVRVGPGKSRTM